MSGQSETYANKYAELIAENDSKYKTNAINEASEYCRILDEGASLKFAEIYSNNMGEYFANHCNNYTESLDDYFANEERNRLKELYKNLW